MLLFLTAPLSGPSEPVVKKGGGATPLEFVTSRSKRDVYLPKYWVDLKSNLRETFDFFLHQIKKKVDIHPWVRTQVNTEHGQIIVIKTLSFKGLRLLLAALLYFQIFLRLWLYKLAELLLLTAPFCLKNLRLPRSRHVKYHTSLFASSSRI